MPKTMNSAEDHFTLKWNDFRSSMTEGFHDFLQEEMMVDVTLAAEGKFLQAHKLVLSVCSPYFKNLFNVNPCKHPIVFLKDVTHLELSYVLQFMYTGEVGVKHEELPSFLKLADTLKLKGLTKIKFDNENDKLLPQVQSNVNRIRKKKVYLCPNLEEINSDSESGVSRLKELRPPRLRKRRFSNSVKSEVCKSSNSKKLKPLNTDLELENENGNDAYAPEGNGSIVESDVKNRSAELNDACSDRDNMSESEDLDEEKSSCEDFVPTSGLLDNSGDADQAPQGGVDYQMIQTKRGKDMLLYDGYTFTQNRMCKDGMRWQCSYPKCKAFCRMSSAGWLTPHKTNHEHPKPSEAEIKKRILRMELKARAQSSGATPGEIIRNALPAEEYQTTDQRACYTRCIQRFRKSLQRKNTKSTDEIWIGDGGTNMQKEFVKSAEPPTEGTSCIMTKHHGKFPLLFKEGLKEEPLWATHSEPGRVPESGDRSEMVKQKNDLHSKMELYGM